MHIAAVQSSNGDWVEMSQNDSGLHLKGFRSRAWDDDSVAKSLPSVH